MTVSLSSPVSMPGAHRFRRQRPACTLYLNYCHSVVAERHASPGSLLSEDLAHPLLYSFGNSASSPICPKRLMILGCSVSPLNSRYMELTLTAIRSPSVQVAYLSMGMSLAASSEGIPASYRLRASA